MMTWLIFCVCVCLCVCLCVCVCVCVCVYSSASPYADAALAPPPLYSLNRSDTIALPFDANTTTQKIIQASPPHTTATGPS